MRKPIFRRALFVLCVAALAFAGCDGMMNLNSNTKRFDTKLEGRWQTTPGFEAKGYNGTLEIDYNSIIIYDFPGNLDLENYTYDKRPFKDYPREIVELTAYSEKVDDIDDDNYKGNIFIKYNGVWSEGIEFTYSEESKPEMLTFNFGDGDIYLAKYQSP